MRQFQPRPAVTLLRHEIAHDLFARYLVPTTRSNQYGTDAPDWLDEMAAIAFEDSDRRLSRRRDAREEGLLPLSTLFRMSHPEFGNPVVRIIGEEFASSSTSSDQTIAFYATLSCLYEFLVEKTGSPGIIADLAKAFTQGRDLEHWITRRLGYGDQSASVDRLDAELKSWLDHSHRSVE